MHSLGTILLVAVFAKHLEGTPQNLICDIDAAVPDPLHTLLLRKLEAVPYCTLLHLLAHGHCLLFMAHHP